MPRISSAEQLLHAYAKLDMDQQNAFFQLLRHERQKAAKRRHNSALRVELRRVGLTTAGTPWVSKRANRLDYTPQAWLEHVRATLRAKYRRRAARYAKEGLTCEGKQFKKAKPLTPAQRARLELQKIHEAMEAKKAA